MIRSWCEMSIESCLKAMRIFLCTLLFPLVTVAAQYRVFTNPDGAQIEAEIINADESKVSIRMRNGRVFKDVLHDRFSVEDRDYIRNWIEEQRDALENADISAEADIRITFLKGRDDDFNEYSTLR